MQIFGIPSLCSFFFSPCSSALCTLSSWAFPDSKLHLLKQGRLWALHSFPILNFFKKKLLLFNYSCLHFLPTPLPHPIRTHLLPPPPPSPLIFAHVSFIVAPVNPSLHCPLPTPLWLLLDCS